MGCLCFEIAYLEEVCRDNLSEWLRRQTRNLLGFARASSNPAVVVFLLLLNNPHKIKITLPLFLLHLQSLLFFLLLLYWNLISFLLFFFFHRNAVFQFLQFLDDCFALLLQHFQCLFLTPPALLPTLGTSVFADTQPVDSTEKMKSFRITPRCTFSRFSGSRIHSRHILSYTLSPFLRAIQIMSHIQRFLSSNVLNIKNSHRTSLLHAFCVFSHQRLRESDRRSHAIHCCAHRGPFLIEFDRTYHFAWSSPIPFVA